MVARLCHDVEEISATMTDTASVRDKDVERADNLGAQFAASVRLKDVYKLVLTTVNEDLTKTRVDHDNPLWSVNDLAANVRETFPDLGGALQVVVESSICSSKNVAD